jgi:hypothetical protein
MADVRITGLPAAGTITGAELVPVVQDGLTVQTTVSAITSSPSLTQTFLTVGLQTALPNSRYFSTGVGLGITDGGAQSSYSIAFNGTAASLETASNGVIVKTAPNTIAARTLGTSGNGIGVTDGDGIAGNPTFALTGLAQALANATGSGILALGSSSTISPVTITGVTNQTSVINGTGAGNPTIGLADNPVIPGTAAVTIPIGTTAQRSVGANGEVRFNSDLVTYEAFAGGAWQQFSLSGGVTTFSAGSTGFAPSTPTAGAVTLSGILNSTSGGTGASALTGYLFGNGASPATASSTIPSTSITGLGTMSVQNANAVAITGGTINGTTLGATTPATVVATQVDITAQGDLRLQDTTGGEYVALQAPATIASSYTLTLPVDDGTAGQALITDGSGVLSWSTAASGDVYGPASATDNAVARYDGTTGKLIQNSVVTIADDGATVIAANSGSDGLRITQIGAGNAILVEDSANPDATPFVVEASGDVLIGTATAIPGAFSDTGKLQIVNNTGEANQTNFTFLNSTGGSIAYFNKSRSATIGTNTIVQSGDSIGTIVFAGADGTTYHRGASISAEVDGTPGVNDMPGRLVFSTTADGASSPTERMRITSAGNVGIGGTPTDKLTIMGDTASGTANPFTVVAKQFASSSATGTLTSYLSFPGTVVASFTLAGMKHYSAGQGTFGAGSAVTNQYGFLAESSLIGATNNYGFYGNIASGTGRYNFYAAGTADNYFAGNVGVTGTPDVNLHVANATAKLRLGSTALNAYLDISRDSATGFSIYNAAQTTFSSHIFQIAGTERARIATTGVISLGAAPGSESLRVTPVASAVNYLEAQGQITTGGPSLIATGSDTNVALLLKTKGTSAVQFYTSGSTLQFFVGHTASAVNYLQVTGSATGGGVSLSAQGSDTNIDLALTPKGTGVLKYGTYTAGILAQAGYITIKDAGGTTRNLLVG